MARIDADRRQPLGAKGMIEPYRQRSGLEHYPFHGWRPLADKLGDEARIRCALATPDPFTCSADRDCRLFHRHVQTKLRLPHVDGPLAAPRWQSAGWILLIHAGEFVARLDHYMQHLNSDHIRKYAAELCRMAVFGTLNPLTPARLQA